MSAVQQKIYDYFERDPELKVLFIFNNEFLAAENGVLAIDMLISRVIGSPSNTTWIMIGSTIK